MKPAFSFVILTLIAIVTTGAAMASGFGPRGLAMPDRAAGVETIAHMSCGSMGTAGRCARGVRSCRATGRPSSVCDRWGRRCTQCQDRFIACGQSVGHKKALTCISCKSAYDSCVARIPK